MLHGRTQNGPSQLSLNFSSKKVLRKTRSPYSNVHFLIDLSLSLSSLTLSISLFLSLSFSLSLSPSLTLSFSLSLGDCSLLVGSDTDGRAFSLLLQVVQGFENCFVVMAVCRGDLGFDRYDFFHSKCKGEGVFSC